MSERKIGTDDTFGLDNIHDQNVRVQITVDEDEKPYVSIYVETVDGAPMEEILIQTKEHADALLKIVQNAHREFIEMLEHQDDYRW